MKRKITMFTKVMILAMAVILTVTSSSTSFYDIDIEVWNESVPLGGKSLNDPSESSKIYMNAYSIQEINKINQTSQLITKQTMNDKAVIDYTYTAYGYVKVQYTENTQQRLKATVKGEDGLIYTYNLTKNEWATLPFSSGSGSYEVTIYENVSGINYKTILKEVVDVSLSSELAPFLSPNQYVNFTDSPKVVQKATELTKNARTDVEKISAIYNYVIKNMTYDQEKAENVKTGYLPDLDKILDANTGICLDYAALIVGMLRSQNIPAKIVVGYFGEEYHAWISVYVNEKNTSICGMRYYDEENWLHMDPTYASVNFNSRAVKRSINDGSSYTGKYYY